MEVIDIMYVRKLKALADAAQRASRERAIQISAQQKMLAVREAEILRLCKELDYVRASRDDRGIALQS